MGTTFPLLLAARRRARPTSRASVGRLTVANTIGTIAGSIVTGYVVLPALGSQGSLRAVAVAFARAAYRSPRRASIGRAAAERAQVPRLLGAAVVARLALALPRWDLARLTNGANVYFTARPAARRDRLRARRRARRRHDGRAPRRASTRCYTNGKFQGDDGQEMTAQRRFAHFPSLFVRPLRPRARHRPRHRHDPRHPRHLPVAAHRRRRDLARRSSRPRAASSPSQSRDALDDPRVRLELNDGRNLLLVATEPYDLVTIELTSVWFAGAASLYSREFYELVRARLAPGGVLQQWVQLHHIRRARARGHRPHAPRRRSPTWRSSSAARQGILVASDAPLVASRARLAALESAPGPPRDPRRQAHLVDLLDELIASEDDLDRFVDRRPEGEPIVSTDDNLYLEYATPKGNVFDYRNSLDARLAELEQYRTNDPAVRHLGP